MGFSFKKFVLVTIIVHVAFFTFQLVAFSLFAAQFPFWQFTTGTIAFWLVSLIAFGLSMYGLRRARQEGEVSKDKVYILQIIEIVLALVQLILILAVFVYALRLLSNPHKGSRIFALGANLPGEQRVLVRYPLADARLRAEYITAAQATDPNASWLSTAEITVTEDSDYTGVLKLLNLSANTEYVARLLVNDAVLDEVHTLRFKTLPLPGTPSITRLSFGSCLLPWWWRGLAGFSAFKNVSSDLVVFLGDFIYADHPMWLGGSVSTYNSHYREAFDDPHVQDVTSSIPTFYMYDDHEWVDNFYAGVGPDDPIYKNAMTAFERYTGAANPDTLGSGRTHYYSFSVGQVDIFVLETRGLRSDFKLPRDTPDKTILGAEQKAFLFNWLQNSTAVFKIIATTYPFTLNTKDLDNWYGFEQERNEVMNFIDSHNISGVMFISADRHWAGVFEVMPGIFEFSASPVDAFMDPNVEKIRKGDDRVLFASGGRKHLGSIQWNTTSNPPTIRVEIIETNPYNPVPLYSQLFALNPQTGRMYEVK